MRRTTVNTNFDNITLSAQELMTRLGLVGEELNVVVSAWSRDDLDTEVERAVAVTFTGVTRKQIDREDP